MLRASEVKLRQSNAVIAAESGAATTTESSVGGNPVLFRLHDPVGDAAGERRRRKRVAAGRLG
nr:hypothetical protein Iba_chr09fCG13340 [Ipomoea batatas]